jgi:chitinase
VPWLYDAKSGRMISYDDPESIGNKAAYIRQEGYGGVMIWELSDDDEQSSLLTAIDSNLRS